MLREHNHAAISNTSVHEAYPGHHLQLSAATTNPSLVRLLAGAPEFAEGWAFYCERMMKEPVSTTRRRAGTSSHTDAIWRATRIILDVRLHRGDHRLRRGRRRLVAETGFERPAALAEVKRYTCTPTYQLSLPVWTPHDRAAQGRRRARARAPDFNLRGFHDTLIYGGTMPVSLRAPALRARTADEARAARASAWPLVVAAACSAVRAAPRRARRRRRRRSRAQATLVERPRDRERQRRREGEFAIDAGRRRAPIATANFVALARCGFYDGISFHRVLAGFVAQAGDPQTRRSRWRLRGHRSGGPGYEFEIEPPADGLDYDPYSVSMANDTRRERQPVLHRARRPRWRLLARTTRSSARWSTGHRCDRRDRRGAGQRPRRSAFRSTPVTIDRIVISDDGEPTPSGRVTASAPKPLCYVKESQPPKPCLKGTGGLF